MQITSYKFLTGVFYFFSLTPFISPYPINTDIQPLAIILALILLILYNTNRSREDLIIILCGLLSIIYIDPLSNLNNFIITPKNLSIFAGLILFMGYRNNNYENIHIFKFVVLLYFSWAIFLFVFPEIIIPIQNNIVRNININEVNPFGYRGVPPLGTEPGLVGGLLVFLLIHSDIYNKKNKNINIFRLLIILTILLTKSGIGYCYLLIYIFIKFFEKTNILLNIIFLIFSYIIYILIVNNINLEIYSDINNRGFDIVLKFLKGDDILIDQSILKRVYDIQIGFYSLRDSLFGVGIAGAQSQINYIANEYELLRIEDYGNEISSVSTLTYLLCSYGVFGLILLIYIFYKSKSNIISKIFSLIFLTVSYSFAFPAIWILLSTKKENNL